MKDKKSYSRSSKVASEIKKVISECLIRGDIGSYEGINPLMIVITDVEVSPCLQHAKVFVSTMSDSLECENYLAFLEEHVAQIRKAIGNTVKLKFVPEVRFFEDVSQKQAMKIEKLLSSFN